MCGNFEAKIGLGREVQSASTGSKEAFQRIVTSSRQLVCIWRPEIEVLLLCQTEEDPKHGSSKGEMRIVSNLPLVSVWCSVLGAFGQRLAKSGLD